MKKVFLYLYPIREFVGMFENLYDDINIEKPLPVLNRCIQKRYRDNEYKVVFVLYPDKELYGIDKKDVDNIIYTDVLFSDASAVLENKTLKKNFIPKYPDENLLLNQLGDIDELIVGGYHAMDCVKRVAEVALLNGIKSIVDLDLTDLFFNLYWQKDYFDEGKYDLERFKYFMINRDGEEYLEINERIFNRNYESQVYGFSKKISKTK